MFLPLPHVQPGRTSPLRRWVGRLLAPALLVLVGTISALAQPTYCNGTSLGGGNNGSITSVSIAATTFSNSTFATPPAGSYYTSYPASVTTATLQPGATYSFTVNLSNTYSAVLWIDYNRNGVFETSEGVQVLSTTTGGTTGTVSFTVPVTASAGLTGLRIRTRAINNTNDPSTSCDLYGSGETQDYVVTIAAAAPCTSPPTAGTAVATPANFCAGGTATLSLTGASFGAGLTYQWQSSTTSATAGFTNIAGATSNSYTTPALTQTTYYRAVLTCSGQSATSTVATVTVLAPTYATIPYTQNFESTWISRCGTNDVPDSNWLNTPNTGNTSWRRDDDGASANWTSPTFPTAPYGTGVALGSTLNGATGIHSARFHNYYAPAAAVGTFDLYVNVGTGTGTPTLKFDYVNPDTNPVVVLLSTDGGVTFPTTLQTLGTITAWTNYNITLPATATATSVIRFQATGNFGSYDNGLDNVSVTRVQALDLAPFALATPTATQGCYGAAEPVAVTIKNQGTAVINFANNAATVTAVVTLPGGGTQTLTGSVTTGTLAAGATQNVTLTPTLNMTALGTYSFAITATVAGDQNTSNDNLTPAVTRTATAPVAGALAAGNSSLCVSGTTSLTLTGSANGTIQLQSSPSSAGPFVSINGATGATFTTGTLTSTTYFRALVSCNTNTATSNVVTVTVNNPVVASAPAPAAAVCAGQTATLTATSAAGTSVRFYTTATGGTALTGATTTGTNPVTTTQVTPTLTTAGTNTFYAEAYTGSQENVGKPSTNGADGSNNVNGLYFTTTGATTINSVTVYQTAGATAGNAVISLFTGQNSSGTGTPIATYTATFQANTASTITPTVVPLNFAVPAAGQYTIFLTSSTTTLCRDFLGGSSLPTTAFPYTSPSGLVSITDGTIAGYYYFFYNWVVGSQCVAATRTAINVTVNPAANAGFSYGTTNAFCRSQAGAVAPVLATGATAGTFSVSPGTLTINFTSGAIMPSTSAPGTYTITNTVAAVGSNCGGSATTTVTITAQPVATFAYPSGTLCAGQAATLTPTLGTGATAGTYTVAGSGGGSGATINATSGVLNLSAATAGTYTVTNTIAASGGCTAQTATQAVTVLPQTTAGFNYGTTSAFCTSQTATQAVVLTTGATAGTFSSTTGLTINATTGAVTPSTSTPGTYTVTNTVAGSATQCGSTSTSAVTITAPQIATFSYPAASGTVSYCAGATGIITPTLGTGATAGTFLISGGAGAPAINSTTGALNLANATAGTYTVTNTLPASSACGAQTSTQTVTVLPLPTATLSAPTTGSTSICQGSSVVLTAPTGTGLTYQFFNGTTSLGAASATNTLTVSAAGSYSVVVTNASGCSATSSAVAVTVNALPATPTLAVTGTPATGLTLTASSTTTGVTYQFYRNGVLIAGTTGNTLLVNSGTNNGTYTVVAVSTQGCSSTASAPQTVTVTATTGAAVAASVRLYPNPTPDGRVSVELKGYPAAASLTVLNALGQVVRTMPAASPNGTTLLDLHELADGVYLLQVQAAGTAPQTLRVVKN